MKNPSNGLKTDLYELTMAAGYFQNKLEVTAIFELSCHSMPKNRSYLIACGLAQIVDYILNLRFSDDEIKFIQSLPVFKNVKQDFFDYLKGFCFTGDVWAMPEGEIFFDREPMIQVQAPIIEAQILETYLLSVLNIESLVASKASRVVKAASADGVQRGVIDFGSRRAHGPEAAVLAARAAYLGGCIGTSNVYAGKAFGIPLYGTVAHSWIEAFDNETEAFERYAAVFPDHVTILVDTFDTLEAVRKITAMNLKTRLKAVRLDSGDLAMLSRKVRTMLDRAKLKHVKIIASGNLNEYKIAELIKEKSPIDIFGVGTDMVVSADAPALNLTYKLVEIHEKNGQVKYKAKHSDRKRTVPGSKQVFRQLNKKGMFLKDSIGLFSEAVPAGTQPLLLPVIKRGRLVKPLPSLDQTRSFVQDRLAILPKACFELKSGCLCRKEYTQALTRLRRKISF